MNDFERALPVSVIQIGIGGMGHHYLQTLLAESKTGRIQLQAAVDPFPETAELYGELKRIGIPVFPKLEDVFSGGLSADLVVVSSPLQFHVEQSLEALQAGCHVLCEKPLAATVQDADVLIHETQKSSKWIRIGYQWSYTDAIRGLKKNILSGRFGKPLRARALYLWPREAAYYRRNNWAGRIKDKEGKWVLDSPAASAMAHDLHNLLFLLGEKMDRSVEPKEVLAELYMANPVENYDTIACRIKTKNGVELLFYASHAVREVRGPFFKIEFEEAVVSFGEKEEGIVAETESGESIACGSPQDENPFIKLYESLEAVRRFVPVVCGPEAARAQTLCVNGIQEATDAVRDFQPPMLRRDEKQIWAEGLSEALDVCYRKGMLPSEADFPWGYEARKVNLEEYVYFPGGMPPAETEGESL
jgi:predicted dehydrogenase